MDVQSGSSMHSVGGMNDNKFNYQGLTLNTNVIPGATKKDAKSPILEVKGQN